ncbi:unnamed protein product [Ilex paraguariensis]|uniref:Uncharacterized protein n=1 Tax=Ilex paraguariensis TaxID=185542 RepID=A0ABC8UTD3_9AQUA
MGRRHGINDDETIIAASQKENKPSIEKEPLVPPKPAYPPSPKLESTGVSPPIDPTTQQKRQSSTSTTAATTAAPPPPRIEAVNCAGLDGMPWPEHTIDRRKERKEQEEYDEEYFKHHKPSPLFEVKMVDTRKSITRATDGTVEDSYYDVEGGGGGVIVWRPEQLDTAEEALYRAQRFGDRTQ